MTLELDAVSGAAEAPQPVDWYRPGKSITEFHASKARIRVLIGGRGSGKTTAIAVETLGHAWRIAGARIYILRKTEQANKDTTLETFEQVFDQAGTVYRDTGQSLFKKIEGGRVFRLPSRKAVELYNAFLESCPNKQEIERWLDTVGNKWCSFVQFSGVPTTSHRATRFRGFECSLLILVEADQFDREDVNMASACLRWKSPDKTVCSPKGFIRDMGMVLDTNPPSPRHWIALWEEEAKSYDNPNAAAFWHIHTAENEHNLADGYVDDLKRMYANNPAMYKRMVEGQYAEAFDGKPVFWAFRVDHSYRNLPFPKGAYLVRGWDFGTTHAVVWSAYWMEKRPDPKDPKKILEVEYWWDLAEMFAEMSDVERQCREVLAITAKAFPFWNDRSMCAGVLDYCDPAGDANKDTGRSISVLNSYQIFPGFSRVSLPVSLALYNRLLEAKDPDGKYVYRIDEIGCPMLFQASMGGYRYPTKDEPGYGSDVPLKGPEGGNYDHIADASRYAKLNLLRLVRAEDAAKPVVGGLARPSKVNRPRKWF